MKKKPTKSHNVWTGVWKRTEMGEEILKENLEANTTYSVLMLSKGEERLNYEWGVIRTGGSGDIIRNYNINVKDDWDANPVRLRSTWRVFKADKVSDMMTKHYFDVLSLNTQCTRFAEKIEELRDYINKHWWRRF